MLRIAICDDMPEFLEQTRALAACWPGQPDQMSVSLFSDGDALVEAHNAAPFDIIFLDVVMPLVGGIATAAEIRRQDASVKIVFVTFSREFAYESYAVKADNYLLKPVDRDTFHRCLDECYNSILKDEKFLTLRCTTGVHRVKLSSIEFIEAQGKLVLFNLSDGSVIEAVEPLYIYENKLLLNDGCFNCHRSYLVNLYKISSYTQNEVTMRSGCRIPISRSLHKQFKEAYFALLFGDLS